MQEWMLLFVMVFVAAHFVVLAFLLVKSAIIRRRERAGRRLSSQRRPHRGAALV